MKVNLRLFSAAETGGGAMEEDESESSSGFGCFFRRVRLAGEDAAAETTTAFREGGEREGEEKRGRGVRKLRRFDIGEGKWQWIRVEGGRHRDREV